MRHRQWFTRWLGCKRERVMPYEIAQYRSKENEIRGMYDYLVFLGGAVDRGLSPVQAVYKEWDRLQLELGMRACLIRVEQADGSSDCVR